MSEDFLIKSYDLNLFSFSKPKKQLNFMVCKIKNDSKDVLIQFPKMETVTSSSKSIELEFKNEIGYNKKIYNFLSDIDNVIIDYVTLHSEEWFDKKIPNQFVTQMYNKFIKPPKTTDNRCTLNFTFNKELSLVDKKNEKVEISEIKKGNTVECIAQMKYLIFSKDSCFVTWEICTAKLFKKILRVPKFGFIEDINDKSEEIDDDPEEIITFF